MGDRLRFARESAELSLEGVGEALGITGSAVSQWETGKTPFKEVAASVRRAHGFRCYWLEFGAGDAQARDKKLWLYSNMVPLITPSQAADANDIRTFLAGFHKELQLGPLHTLSADFPPVITSRFPCSIAGGFALEIFDRRNATEYEIGDIIILDADEEPVPGDMVFAAIDVEKRPVFAKYLPRGRHTILKPLNSDWGGEVMGPVTSKVASSP